MHFRVGAKAHGFVSWAAVSLGLWIVLNTYVGLRKNIPRIIEAKKNKIPLPLFRFVSIQQNWECFVYLGFYLISAAFASYVLVRFLSANDNWFLPFRAATIAISGCTLGIILFWRGLNSSSHGSYEALERDVMLNKLGPDEIKSRFERQILGRSVAQWLDELLDAVETSDKKLSDINASISPKAAEALAIEPSYAAERADRGNRLVDELTEAIRQHKSEFEKFRFQIGVFLKEYRGDQAGDILIRWIERLKERTEKSSGVLSASLKLVEELKPLIPQKK